MNTRPENNIPQEWLDSSFLEQVVNAYYTGEDSLIAPNEEPAVTEKQKPTPNPPEEWIAPVPVENTAGRIELTDYATPSIRDRYQSNGLYFLSNDEQPKESTHKEDSAGTSSFPVETIRQDFPILHQKINGKPLVWFDNAATTQKPQRVIDAISRFYEQDNSNIHRGVHELADRATNAYEHGRQKVKEFIGARDTREIIFLRGTTEAINLVAQTYGRKYFKEKDEIVLTIMEHHANIVPWQMLCQETGAVLRIAPCNDMGEILLDEYAALLNSKTKLVALTQVSNVLGTVNPIEVMTQMAHGVGARVLIDGAQSIPHVPVNVQAIDCDFFVFSGHKLFAPTGIGVLYGKAEVLDMMPPWQGGGNMIQDVSFERTVYNGLPQKFEAGTGNIADVVGLGAAIEYLEQVGFHAAMEYEETLLAYAIKSLSGISGLKLIGTAPNKVSVVSFVLEGISNENLGRQLNQEGIAVRTGHHCAQPILRRFGVENSVRPSLAFYNTFKEIDTLVEAIYKIKKSVHS
jgi:cysteine desulfurase/selenocysteine lyase